jgi:ElaB/YqjD/DUF883 family membrane-anchored ribosome-binding protein
MSIARHHAEWLSLVEVSGPFLSLPLLEQTFPQGIETVDSETRERLHLAHEEWLEGVSRRADPALHHAWVRFVFREALGYDERDVLQDEAALRIEAPEHRDTVRASFAIINPDGRPEAGKPRLLVSVVDAGHPLDKPLTQATWKASPVDRLLFLMRGLQAPGSGARLGLVTNGSEWVLLHVAPAETTTYVRWSSELWFDEPLTLRALVTLVGVKRLFGVPDDETLEALIGRSSKDAHDVTDKLGAQVRRATEVLVQTIDRLDRGRRGTLLEGIAPVTVYEAAVTVMMRLIFVLAAEERKLLLLGTPVYDQHYAISTLHDQLQAMADRQGEEVLEKRFDAWCRLLSTFRGIFGGIEHSDLRLPAHGGSLFDPDRFPFLEGRTAGTSWRDAAQKGALPLAVDNRTVLHLLRAITRLEVKAGGGRVESRRVSFRALDVEQIGHVYEGLLDHTAKRATDVTLSLQGKHEPELSIAELEARQKNGNPEFVAWLAEATGRSASALSAALEQVLPPEDERVFLQACDGQPAVLKRVRPWASLVRRDTQGRPVVIPPGALYVTEGADRRSTGTHYTPRNLTEPIVQHALEPLVYEGPAEGKPREAWRLKSTTELLALRICDLAMGSGAFLVEACRYLSARLVESWAEAEARLGHPLVLAAEGELARGETREQIAPADPDERLALARRLVAARCLYGVDINPYAVEMAKLSLWLTTMQKGRPFTFVDHALRCGDSLLGVSDERQILRFHLDPARFETRQHKLSNVEKAMRNALARAREAREELEEFGTDDINDALRKTYLLNQAGATSEDLQIVGNLLVGAALKTAKRGKLDGELEALHEPVIALFKAEGDERQAKRDALRARAEALLNAGREAHQPARRPFHWAVEFPETMQRGGFDGFVGNPPFMGGQRLTGAFGTDYRDYLVAHLASGRRGSADLCAYFFLRATSLLAPKGGFGLVATNTIAQGDTREVGLDALTEQGAVITRALPSTPWPGDANLEVAYVWLRKSAWAGETRINGRIVRAITSQLTPPGRVAGKPYRLAANAGKSFQGSNVLGLGFTMSPEEAAALIKRDAKNREVLFPYLSGRDLNSDPEQRASRWVINFRDWPLDRSTAPPGYQGPVASDYPDCLDIVRRLVKPERDANNRGTRSAAKRQAHGAKGRHFRQPHGTT